MTPTLQQILDSKRALRRELATRPIAEKLRMLEAMRERAVAIRAGGSSGSSSSHKRSDGER